MLQTLKASDNLSATERELTTTDNAPTDMATAFNVNTEALMQREMFMQAKSHDLLYYALMSFKICGGEKQPHPTSVTILSTARCVIGS